MKWKVVAAIAVAVLVAAGIVAAVVSVPDRTGPGTGSATSTGAPTRPGVLVVKVDNAPAARPQTGLGSADLVYVEPVEGGATRFAAVYAAPPDLVGPVRSARETDVELLAAYRSPVLAYSGSAPELAPLLERSGMVRASPREAGGAYFRDDSRTAPHNLYVRPRELPRPAAGPRADTPVGAAPPGGRPVTTWSVRYPGAAFDLAWTGAWAISVDGAALRSVESGPVAAQTVVVQQVRTRTGRFVEDAAGNPSPVVVSVGTGSAVVLRDGLAFDVTWSRPTPSDPTRLTLPDGAEVPLAPGRTWVFLLAS